MNNVQQLLQRQANWQRSRRRLSWPEKVRMIERIRESIIALRKGGKLPPEPRGVSGELTGENIDRP